MIVSIKWIQLVWKHLAKNLLGGVLKRCPAFHNSGFASVGNYDFYKTITPQASWASLGLQKKITS